MIDLVALQAKADDRKAAIQFAQEEISALKAEPNTKSILELQARVAKLEDIVLSLVKRL